ncbi:hypothetical protein Hypma_010772 [Hypsizygus marmoreus]|uniref:Uncharacterized protein n=1 Tax=Hypsizygus marmoreus TaxID=39966 RepID=A0A369JR21_HYPMA|nr:hypothetical protein Hypma_010772 [Hypsizygus marmoreus]
MTDGIIRLHYPTRYAGPSQCRGCSIAPLNQCEGAHGGLHSDGELSYYLPRRCIRRLSDDITEDLPTGARHISWSYAHGR